MTTPKLTTYRLAIVLFPNVTALDFGGAIELFGILSPEVRQGSLPLKHLPDALITTAFLSHTLDPVHPFVGPDLVPTQTFSDATEQFDFILIPGGPGAHYNSVDPSLLEFLKRQEPGAKHILTVCTGSWILAGTGLLDGKKATTNKLLFRTVQEDTKDRPITWIPKARWVVADDSKKIWTSSGVTAGMDMTAKFMEYLFGKGIVEEARAVIELTLHGEDEDEFAEHFGLV